MVSPHGNIFDETAPGYTYFSDIRFGVSEHVAIFKLCAPFKDLFIIPPVLSNLSLLFSSGDSFTRVPLNERGPFWDVALNREFGQYLKKISRINYMQNLIPTKSTSLF